ncbi:hypothetical protein ILUMI_18916 [Ignelater luminosus]|uniref:Odorant receptor n=1 Tax=Ignelater luminosus TaxID=2038154 RepID=A0A8K0CNB0_IGNLU|nr:hypothetical protein ILUMI_18916 [Ignelater luminosus]
MDQVLVAEIPESVRLPFLGLRRLGLFSTNKFKAYTPMTLWFLILGNLIPIAMLQFINGKLGISDIVRNLEEILSFTLILLRMVIVTYRNEDFTRLIQTIKLFWDPSRCDQQTKMELISIRGLTSQLQRLLLVTLSLCLVFVVIFPVLQKTTPTGIWTMEGHEKLYRFVIIEQTIIVPCSAFFLSSLDCMYLGFCAEIVIQFRILSQRLQELNADGSSVNEMEINRLNEIKSCVSHHRLILRFVKEFRQAFSLVLLIEFVIDGPLICAELLAAFESQSFQNQVRHVIIFIFLTIQLAFFCIPANHITNEAMAVSDAAYFTNWYTKHIPSLKVPLTLIIQNSQDEITITAGGLVIINAGTIVNVLKVAWSACSLVRGLRQI